MFRMLLAISMALMSVQALSRERQSPIGFVVDLTEEFNAGDMEEYVERFAYPHSRVVNSRFVVVTDPEVSSLAYSQAIASGWAYSKINTIEIIEESASFALVRVNFSRYDKDDTEMITFNAYYTMGHDGERWQILHLASSGQPPSANRIR